MARTPLRKDRTTLSTRDDGSLRLGVVADTHSAPHPDLSKHLASLRPDAILHAGDIGDLNVLDGLRAIAPLYAIRGNIDIRAPDLPDVLTLSVGSNDLVLLRILLVHIGVNGPNLRADIVRLARAERASLVVCGHSHVPFIGRQGELTVFNPGSVGPRRFQLPIVFGVLDIGRGDIRLRHIDCETGLPWSPPPVLGRATASH